MTSNYIMHLGKKEDRKDALIDCNISGKVLLCCVIISEEPLNWMWYQNYIMHLGKKEDRKDALIDCNISGKIPFSAYFIVTLGVSLLLYSTTVKYVFRRKLLDNRVTVRVKEEYFLRNGPMLLKTVFNFYPRSLVFLIHYFQLGLPEWQWESKKNIFSGKAMCIFRNLSNF